MNGMSVMDAYLKPIDPSMFKHKSGKFGRIAGMKYIKPTKTVSYNLYYIVVWNDMINEVPVYDVTSGKYVITDKDQ